MRRIARRIGFLLLLVSTTAGAGEWELSGSAAVELRVFLDSPRYPEQLQVTQASPQLFPEARWYSTNGRNFATFAALLRGDRQDVQRRQFDLAQGYWRTVGNSWELLAGVNKVFWGVTESAHLVDVVNQTDLAADIDGEDKLGQPMVSFALQRDWGRLEAFALVGFRERTFPGAVGRLRLPLPVDTDVALYESAAGNRRVDGAMRYSHFIGNWDLGAYLFHGTSREPRFLPDLSGERLVPVYDVIDQLGLDFQYTRGAWLAKFEGIARDGHGETFGAIVAGFEHTRYQVLGSSLDLGLLLEYLRDERSLAAPFTAFEDDVFLGSRLAFNDTADTALLVGGIVDLENGSTAARIEAERRFGQRVRLELEGRFFLNVDPLDPLTFFEQDSYVSLRTAFFF
jgi:hypothetical protein